jgi:ATP-binding cassette subfamily F protein 3
LTAGRELATKPETRLADRPSIRNKEQKRAEAELRQARSRERREQQQFVRALESEIHEFEMRQAALTVELESAETYEKPGRAMEVNRELIALLDQVKERSAQWELAATKLIELEQ